MFEGEGQTLFQRGFLNRINQKGSHDFSKSPRVLKIIYTIVVTFLIIVILIFKTQKSVHCGHLQND